MDNAWLLCRNGRGGFKSGISPRKWTVTPKPTAEGDDVKLAEPRPCLGLQGSLLTPEDLEGARALGCPAWTVSHGLGVASRATPRGWLGWCSLGGRRQRLRTEEKAKAADQDPSHQWRVQDGGQGWLALKESRVCAPRRCQDPGHKSGPGAGAAPDPAGGSPVPGPSFPVRPPSPALGSACPASPSPPALPRGGARAIPL